MAFACGLAELFLRLVPCLEGFLCACFQIQRDSDFIVVFVLSALDVQDYWVRKPSSTGKARALEQELQLLFCKQFLFLVHLVFHSSGRRCMPCHRGTGPFGERNGQSAGW